MDRLAWTINGLAVTSLSREAIPWDETAAKGGAAKITVRHYIYLKTLLPLIQGMEYRIGTPYGSVKLAFDEHSTPCASIKVNQEGYSARSQSRYANLGIWLGDAGSHQLASIPRYTVIRESDGSVVLSGLATYFGDDSAATVSSSGEEVYRLDLAALPAGGPYHIVVAGMGRSRSFGVGEPWSSKIAVVHVRGLTHQRCGIALDPAWTAYSRDICSNHTEVAHTKTTWGPSTWIEVPAGSPMHPIRGGYHDAADFDRRPAHVIIPTLMLAYFEAFASSFTDSQYGIPESGNGIPDFLDEALWGVLGWEYLQLESGAVMGGTETHRHPIYGEESAATEVSSAVYGTWAPNPAVTASAAGFFALASRLLTPYDPERAKNLLLRAESAWNWLQTPGIQAIPSSGIMYAALQLYLATAVGNSAPDMVNPYHLIFRDRARRLIVEDGNWPDQYRPGNLDARITTAHFSSYLFCNAAVEKPLRDALTARIILEAERGGYMGSLAGHPYAQGVTKSYGWGAGTAQGRYADVYCFAWALTKRQDFLDTVSQYADYSLGLNPLGKSFVTGLGSDQVNSPLHLDSWFTKYGEGAHAGAPKGNVPGIVIFGPSEGRSNTPYQRAVSDLRYPVWENLPGQRRWADGWALVNNNEFSVWETMVWNLCMYAFLAGA